MLILLWDSLCWMGLAGSSMFSRVLLVMLLTILQASPSSISEFSCATIARVARSCTSDVSKSAVAKANRMLMRTGAQVTEQSVMAASSTWKVRYFPKAVIAAKVCKQQRTYAVMMRGGVGWVRMSSGGKTKMHTTICRMMETMELKKTMRMDRFASPNFFEKKVLLHVPITRGAEVATPLKPSRLSRMVRTAASSSVVKLKTIWTMSLVRSRGERGGAIASIQNVLLTITVNDQGWQGLPSCWKRPRLKGQWVVYRALSTFRCHSANSRSMRRTQRMAAWAISLSDLSFSSASLRALRRVLMRLLSPSASLRSSACLLSITCRRVVFLALNCPISSPSVSSRRSCSPSTRCRLCAPSSTPLRVSLLRFPSFFSRSAKALSSLSRETATSRRVRPLMRAMWVLQCSPLSSMSSRRRMRQLRVRCWRAMASCMAASWRNFSLRTSGALMESSF